VDPADAKRECHNTGELEEHEERVTKMPRAKNEATLDAAAVFTRTRNHRMGYVSVDVSRVQMGSKLRRPGVKGKSFFLATSKTVSFSSNLLIHLYCAL
jgi:hypothetical protein